jgi:hypothetical protein
MDNFTVKIRGTTRQQLEFGLKVIFSQEGDKATYYAANEHGIMLFSSKPSYNLVTIPQAEDGEERLTTEPVAIQKLPYALTALTSVEFLWNWLRSVDYKKSIPVLSYFDGSTNEGFELVAGDDLDSSFSWPKLLQLTPIWALYGK